MNILHASDSLTLLPRMPGAPRASVAVLADGAPREHARPAVRPRAPWAAIDPALLGVTSAIVLFIVLWAALLFSWLTAGRV
jgi:hypothetical protein